MLACAPSVPRFNKRILESLLDTSRVKRRRPRLAAEISFSLRNSTSTGRKSAPRALREAWQRLPVAYQPRNTREPRENHEGADLIPSHGWSLVALKIFHSRRIPCRISAPHRVCHSPFYVFSKDFLYSCASRYTGRPGSLRSVNCHGALNRNENLTLCAKFRRNFTEKLKRTDAKCI